MVSQLGMDGVSFISALSNGGRWTSKWSEVAFQHAMQLSASGSIQQKTSQHSRIPTCNFAKWKAHSKTSSFQQQRKCDCQYLSKKDIDTWTCERELVKHNTLYVDLRIKSNTGNLGD